MSQTDHVYFYQITSISSILSAMIAKSICHPIDTIKSRLQVDIIQLNNIKKGLFQKEFKKIIQKEGLKGLYQGIGISIVGLIPAMSLYFSSYEYSKDGLAFFTAGMIAEAISCIFWLPIDIIKERLQVQNIEKFQFGYKNSCDAFQKIIYKDGVIGLYRAYCATVMSFGPFSALYFLFYEKQKQFFNAKVPTFYQSMLYSSISGCLASVLTNPLDISKLRMQIQRGNGLCTFGYKNMFHGIYLIFINEGFLSLYKGSMARCLYHTPYTAITMSLLEKIRENLLKTF